MKRVALLKTAIAEEAANILRLPPAAVDPLRPLSEMGMDSLMAVELRLALESRLRVDLPLMSLAEGTSVASIATRLANAVAGAAAGQRGAEPGRALRGRSTTDRLAAVADAAEPFDPTRVQIGRRGVAGWRRVATFSDCPLRPRRGSSRSCPRRRRGSRRRPGRAPAARTRRGDTGRLDVSRLEAYPRNPHDRGGGRLPRHRRSVLSRASGHRRRRDRDRRPLLRRISPRTTISGSMATRESPRRRRRRSTATAPRCRRAARSPASARSTASWKRALARIHGAEDCVALVGGHSTNVTVIGHLLGRNDVIVHDSLIHNSIVQGAILSGARRVPFRHLDPDAADKALSETRAAPRPRAARHRGALQHGRRRARPRRLYRGGATASRLADGRRGACARRARGRAASAWPTMPASTRARSTSGWAR